jgi:hypothetical protein
MRAGGETWDRVVITAVGETGILGRAVAIKRGAEGWQDQVLTEKGWILAYRDWRKVEGGENVSESDPINRPAHYTHSEVEPIAAIEAWGLGYHLGNVVKYIARHQNKGRPIEDLKKAAWYLAREIGRLEALK